MVIGLPHTYAEAVDRLLGELTPEHKEMLCDFPEDELARQHLGLAMRVRNEYGLRQGNGELLRSCAEEAGRASGGLVVELDADAASLLIVRGARERLRAERHERTGTRP